MQPLVLFRAPIIPRSATTSTTAPPHIIIYDKISHAIPNGNWLYCIVLNKRTTELSRKPESSLKSSPPARSAPPATYTNTKFSNAYISCIWSYNSDYNMHYDCMSMIIIYLSHDVYIENYPFTDILSISIQCSCTKIIWRTLRNVVFLLNM